MRKTLFRWIGRLFFFGSPLFLLAVGVAVWMLWPIFGPIDPVNVSRAGLVNLTRFRDFRTLPSETLAKLTQRNIDEFGRNSPNPPVFDFSATEKKVYASFTKNRQPGGTYFETNLRVMSRTKYFEWMNRFESTSGLERTIIMNEVVDDMNWWKKVYFDYLHAVDLPIPSVVELMKEFDEMIESFKQGATSEEIARIESFKRSVSLGLAAREISEKTKALPGIVGAALESLLAVPKK